MKKIIGRLLLMPIFLFFIQCKETSEECAINEAVREIPVSLEIHRLEDAFFENVSVDEIKYQLEAHPQFREAIFGNMGYDNLEDLSEALISVHQDTAMQELYEETKVYFSDFSAIEEELRLAFQSIKYHYPDYKTPKVYTFITGFGTDLIITEDLIVIGLDYFLPNDHKFQPLDLPNYISKRYNREHLIPTIVTAISSQFNQTNLKDNTLLAEMIFYGKAYHFTKSIMPCTPDELIIGYESNEVTGSYANETLIWGHFIENELLYETNPFVIRKYTGEAPSTDEISPDAPGRLGRWLGWNIVDDYRINNELTLPEIMKQEDAREIFKLSGYKPR